MQRLALAVLLVGAVIALVTYMTADLRKTTAGRDRGDGQSLMQRVAYFVLIALIVYVSVMGAGA